MVDFWSNKQKEISKKDQSWTQAKARNPKLLPFSDTDKDGVSNWLDCKPFDRKRQDDKKLTKAQVRNLYMNNIREDEESGAEKYSKEEIEQQMGLADMSWAESEGSD